MDSLDFDKFDELITSASGMPTGKILGAFEALQEIVGTVTLLASLDPMTPSLCEQFYPWYMGHLIKLHDRAERVVAAQGISYQLKAYHTSRVALVRTTAVLETLASLGWIEKGSSISKAS